VGGVCQGGERESLTPGVKLEGYRKSTRMMASAGSERKTDVTKVVGNSLVEAQGMKEGILHERRGVLACRP